ncbi:hypothetical protein Tco_0911788 [Tanacetum coccineum]
MAFGNFMFAEDDEEMSFLPRDPSTGFGVVSPSALINNEPPLLEVEPLDSANLEQLVKNTMNSGGSLAREEILVIGSGSVAEIMKNRKCRTKGYTKPLVKHKPVYVGLSKAPELQTAIDCHLMIFNVTPLAWRSYLNNQLDVELLDLHDHCYARQTMEREKAKDREYEELMQKCDAAMTGFDNNHAVNVLHHKIKSLSDEVAALDVKKGKLEVAEATLHQEFEAVKCDRAEVVLKVVPYVVMELVHSNEMAMLVGKLVSSTIFYGRCAAFEEVAIIADPSASVEALLFKKPKSLCRLTSTKTHAPAPSAPS